jgi:hypothetical protein
MNSFMLVVLLLLGNVFDVWAVVTNRTDLWQRCSTEIEAQSDPHVNIKKLGFWTSAENNSCSWTRWERWDLEVARQGGSL